jgi:molecular chaperone DnaJ
VDTIDNKKLELTIPAGTQPDTVFSCRNEGLPNMRNRVRGNLLVKIKIQIPRNLTESQKDVIRHARANGI